MEMPPQYFASRIWEKYENPPESIADVLAGIRTEHLSNTNLESYLLPYNFRGTELQ